MTGDEDFYAVERAHAKERGYPSLILTFPVRCYEATVTVLVWSSVGQSHDEHIFPGGFRPEEEALRAMERERE